jgi:hypothetical protein
VQRDACVWPRAPGRPRLWHGVQLEGRAGPRILSMGI